MANIGEILVSEEIFVYNTLIYVLEYLDIKDLINCAQVCPLWKWVVSEDPRWKNVQICCCENDLKQLNRALGGYMQDVVIKMNRSKPTKVFKEFVKENNLTNITLVDCRMEHLYLLSRYQRNLDELHAVLAEIDPHPLVIKRMNAFANLTFLEVNDPGPVTELNCLRYQPQLRHLTLTSKYGPTTWYEVLSLIKLESLTIYGDLGNYHHHWIDILFEQGWILWLPDLEKLKLIWYYEKFPICQYPFIMDKITRMESLTDLTLRGVTFRLGKNKNFPLDHYLAKCDLDKIEVQFGEVENIWNPRLAVTPVLKESAEENVDTILGFLELKYIKVIHWILLPLVKRIALFEYFLLYLCALARRAGRLVTVTTITLQPNHVVKVPISQVRQLLESIKPNTEIIIEDVISYRKRKTEKHCIVCDKVVFSRQLLNQVG